MRELKRVVLSPFFVILIIISVFLNGLLFVRQQKLTGYGFNDYYLTNPGLSEQEANQVLKEYIKLLDKYRVSDYETAIIDLTEQSDLATLYDNIANIVFLQEIALSTEKGKEYWEEWFEEQYSYYENNYSEVVQAIKHGLNWDTRELNIQSVAAAALLKQFKYINEYDSYLKGIQNNSVSLQRVAAFSHDDGYIRENIQKTGEDFSLLDDYDVELGNDYGITAFVTWKGTNYTFFLLLAMCSLLIDAHKNGLWILVHATPNGRHNLSLKRIQVMAVLSFVITIFLYGSTFLLSLYIYGGWKDLGRAIQSIELFRTLPINTTVYGFLFQYLFARIITGFVSEVVIWDLDLLCNGRILRLLLLIAAIIAAEYIGSVVLPEQSLFDFFKYYNFDCFINLEKLYTEYKNINLFGHAVGMRRLVLTSTLPLAILTVTGAILIQPYRFSTGKSALAERVQKHLDRLDDLHRRMGLTGFEIYKFLITQHGALFIILFCFMLLNVSYSKTISYTIEDMYHLMFQGEITYDTYQDIKDYHKELEAGIQLFENAELEYSAGEMDTISFNENLMNYGNNQKRLDTLVSVENSLEFLEKRGEELGEPLWLLYEPPFERVYGMDAISVRMEWNFLLLLSLCLILAGFIPMENRAGLRQITKPTCHGRRGLIKRKYLIAGMVSLLLWGLTSYKELHEFLPMVDRSTLIAPVQSLTCLVHFPYRMSLLAFLCAIYICRLGILLGFSALVLTFSSIFHQNRYIHIIISSIFAFPSALWCYFDIPVFQYVSIIRIFDLIGLIELHAW